MVSNMANRIRIIHPNTMLFSYKFLESLIGVAIPHIVYKASPFQIITIKDKGGRSHPYQSVLLIIKKGAYAIVNITASQFVVDGYEVIAIETAESVGCSQPEIAIGILYHIVNQIRRQTVMGRDASSCQMYFRQASGYG